MYDCAPIYVGGECQWGDGTGLRGNCKWRSGMSCSTSSQMWDSWYWPRFLFKGGSLILMNIASLMVLVESCSFLPTIEKLSNVMLCSVWKWLKMGEGALRCSLYLSPELLPVSPMYSILQLGWSYLYLYMTSPFWMILSFPYGTTKSSLTVLAPLKWTWTPALPHMFLKLSLMPLEYGTRRCYGFCCSSYGHWCCFAIVFHWVGNPIWIWASGIPSQDNCIYRVLLRCVGFLVSITVGWNKHAGPCVREYCKCCICW